MDENLHRRRCPHCGTDLTALARLVTTTGAPVLERHETPPGPLPTGTIAAEWMTLPCLHPLHGILLWDAVVDLDWGHDVAANVCRPVASQLAA
ncbi:hypothetical protein O7626_40525 [Micromonospora sp. WMMD1102]|uniref:hypothetical protein n=1 Tax=Micromonospora sp. WMMD1102 TaxID=3016105 RepID=UPI00241530DE|nr:hypothetical protein [Micromonospora sp. WMMD1102]MDG4792103.1 hypothetical protein [Micromonospora sp. WMMD1102]